MTACTRFLERYSDFRDELLPADERAELCAHMDDCSSCARYDRVIRGGVAVLGSMPPLDPPDDFAARLQLRIDRLDAESEMRSGSGAPVGITVALAATIAAAAWIPAVREVRAPLVLPAASAHAPHHPGTLPLRFHPGAALATGAPAQLGSGATGSLSPFSLLGTDGVAEFQLTQADN